MCAAVEAARAFYLLCTPKLFGLLPQDRRLLIAGGVAEGIYEWESRKCRTCGSHPLRPIREGSDLLLPPDCLCAH